MWLAASFSVFSPPLSLSGQSIKFCVKRFGLLSRPPAPRGDQTGAQWDAFDLHLFHMYQRWNKDKICRTMTTAPLLPEMRENVPAGRTRTLHPNANPHCFHRGAAAHWGARQHQTLHHQSSFPPLLTKVSKNFYCRLLQRAFLFFCFCFFCLYFLFRNELNRWSI